jgi:hypothetical protein
MFCQIREPPSSATGRIMKGTERSRLLSNEIFKQSSLKGKFNKCYTERYLYIKVTVYGKHQGVSKNCSGRRRSHGAAHVIRNKML